MENKLAIVIPFYKIDFFEDTLKSLYNQDNNDFKVYIGDDCSPENVMPLINKYNDRLNIIYQRFEQNIGGTDLVAQWIRCLKLIQNENWFMILGDDDVLSNSVVSDFYYYFSEFEHANSVLRYSSQVINQNANIISDKYVQPVHENAIDSYLRKLAGKNRSSLSEYIFRKDMYDKYGFKNYKLGWTTDDRAVIDFSNLKDIFSINTSIVYFRVSDKHISSKTDNINIKKNEKINSLFDILNDYKSVLTKEQKIKFLNVLEFEILYNSNFSIFSFTKLLYHHLFINEKRHGLVLLVALFKK